MKHSDFTPSPEPFELDLDDLLHPAQAFAHPRDVVADADLTVNEKRAVLASCHATRFWLFALTEPLARFRPRAAPGPDAPRRGCAQHALDCSGGAHTPIPGDGNSHSRLGATGRASA
jgi:hypothetical protein